MRRALYVGKMEWEKFKNLFHAHFARQFKFDNAEVLRDVIDKLCASGAYDLYLIDCDEKEIDPKKLWSDIIELGGERPVIFIGNANTLSARLDKKSLGEHVEAQLLERPYSPEAFKATIDEAIDLLQSSVVEHNTIDGNEEEFLPVKLRSFYLHSKISFDAYAKIMAGKFLKVISKDQRYSISYLQTYVRKGVKSLYLKKDERFKMLDQSASQTQLILAMPDIGLKKALTIQGVGIGIVHEYIRILGPVQTAFDLTNALIESVRRFSKQGTELFQILSQYDFSNKTIEGRSLLTAYIVDAMAVQQGWVAEMSRKKLALAAILHDCNLQDDQMSLTLSSSDSIFEKLSQRDKELYLQHPARAGEIAAQFSDVPEVDFIVQQHHENALGEGFPRQMSSLQITTMSATFTIAVQFATYVCQIGIDDQNLKKIMAKLKQECEQGNYRPAFKALEEIVKMG